MSPGIAAQQLHSAVLKVSHGPDHFGMCTKAIIFPKSFYALVTGFNSAPVIVQEDYSHFLFFEAFSFGYKTHLVLSRGSQWRTGRDPGLYLVFKDRTLRGTRGAGHRSGLGFKPSFMPPCSHPRLSQRDTRFPKCSSLPASSLATKHLPSTWLLGSERSYRPLPPSSSRKPPLLFPTWLQALGWFPAPAEAAGGGLCAWGTAAAQWLLARLTGF